MKGGSGYEFLRVRGKESFIPWVKKEKGQMKNLK